MSGLFTNRTRVCRVDHARWDLVFWMHKRRGQLDRNHRVHVARIKASVLVEGSDDTMLRLELMDGTDYPEFHMLNVPHDHRDRVRRFCPDYPEVEFRTA